MKKLSIQNVKKLSKLEMKRIMAGSDGGGSGGGTGGGGGGGQNDCNGICFQPGQSGGACSYVCTYCYAPAGSGTGVCQA